MAKIPKDAKDIVDETFEVLDLTRNNNSFIDQMFGDVKKTSPLSQLAVGGGTGWVTGYLLVKVGKAAALTLIVSGVAVKVAHDKGLITINKRAVNDAMDKLQHQAQKITVRSSKSYSEMAAHIYNKYKYLSLGFSGGFLAAVLF